MKKKILFTLFAIIMAITCNAQKKLFLKAIEAGRQPDKFYIINNKNKKVNLNELQAFAKENNYILGDYTSKEINRFGDIETSLGTLEFLPISEYNMYIFANIAPEKNSLLSAAPQQCDAIIFKGFSNAQPFKKCYGFTWHGNLANGKPEGTGLGYVKDGNSIIFVLGEYHEGFPVGDIETIMYNTKGQYNPYSPSSVTKQKCAIGKMGDGMASFKQNDAYGFFSSEGNIVITPKYNKVLTPFANGKSAVFDGIMECIIDKNGNFLDYTDHQKQLMAQAEGIRNQAINMANGNGVSRNTVQAVELFKKAAAMGDAEAQFRLALCYHNGEEGIEKNVGEAFKWYQASANQGNAKAIRNLGVCYENGDGVNKDNTKAQEQYRKAFPGLQQLAEQGNAEGQCYLGLCYYYGDGVTKDYAKAVEWYRKAAEQGNADAQNNLGNSYYIGNGVTKDYAKAVEWYRKAAEQGDANSQYSLGYCYYYGEGVTKDDVKAVEWYRKAAEQGDADAQNCLGLSYKNGEGVTKDYAKAVEWYRKAAEQGDANAQDNLGDCYYNGEGVTKDYAKAVEWYRKAAEQGNDLAQYSLGYCYQYGEGVTEDDAKAVEWYRKAAEQGNSSALLNLGYCYDVGEGVTEDKAKAVNLYQKAAAKGEAVAMCNLGNCYRYGIGVQKNMQKAIEWYKKAEAAGNERASSLLEDIRDEKAAAAKRAQFNKRLGYNTANTSIAKLVSVGRNINAVIDYINTYYVNGYDYFINFYQDWGGGSKNYKLYRTVTGSGSSRRGNYCATIYTQNGRITSVTW